MNIDKDKLYDFYYTDDERNQLPAFSEKGEYELTEEQKSKFLTYHSAYVCMARDEMWTSIPEEGKRVDLGSVYQTWSNDLVTAMVRSGDFDAHDAIVVVTQCCERCLNILGAKYLNEIITTPDYLLKNWERPCRFCEAVDDKYIQSEVK